MYQAGRTPTSLRRAREYVFTRCSACLYSYDCIPFSVFEFLLAVPSRDRWENRISERDELQFTRQSTIRCLPQQLHPLSISHVADFAVLHTAQTLRARANPSQTNIRERHIYIRTSFFHSFFLNIGLQICSKYFGLFSCEIALL